MSECSEGKVLLATSFHKITVTKRLFMINAFSDFLIIFFKSMNIGLMLHAGLCLLSVPRGTA